MGLGEPNGHRIAVLSGLPGPQSFGVAVGVMADGGRVGVLVVLSRTSLDGEAQGRAEFLCDVADLAAFSLPGRRNGASRQEGTRAKAQVLIEAVEALPEAVAIFDRHDRFLFWNSHFERIYAPPGVVLRVGVRFEDHLRACLAKDYVVAARGREAQWLAERMARFHACDGVREHQLGNGSWVRVQDRALPNGGTIGIRSDITELVGREQSIRLLFDANPVPMLLIERNTFRILSVNAAATEFYGYAEAAFLDLSLTDLRPEAYPGEIAEQVERITDPSFAAAARKHVTSDREQRVVKVRACTLDYAGRPCILAAVFDMTDQHRMEAEVQRARSFLRDVVDNIPSPVFVKDLEDGGRYVLLNRAGAAMLGRPADEIVGRTSLDLFGPESAERFVEQDDIAARLGGSGTVDEQDIADAEGRRHRVRTRKVALRDHGGAPRYVLGIAEDVTEQRLSEARIAHMAHHDALTDLPNRFLMSDRLEAALTRLSGSSEMLALHCIDLDGFKAVNDAWGHAMGDQLLCSVAARMRSLARPSDTVCRLGGDEFVVLQAPISQMGEAAWFAGRLRASLSTPYLVDGRTLSVGASIGVALAPGDGVEGDALMASADAALYQAKHHGRNRFRFADPTLNAHTDIGSTAGRSA